MISKEQVEELAKWCGFKTKKGNFGWYLNDKYFSAEPPDFPHDLNACFKYIVPKLNRFWLESNFEEEHRVKICQGDSLDIKSWHMAKDKEPATALCLAVLKLIKEEKDANKGS